MSKKVLFIDRDGTLIIEPPVTHQIDSFEVLDFYPQVITWLGPIARRLDFELVMVTNQDGLGTDSFPEESFRGPHELMLKTLKGEGIQFAEVLIDKSFAAEHKDTRKPDTGLLKKYIDNPEYDLAGSYVIGDRLSDMQLAKNLGCKGFLLNDLKDDTLADTIALQTLQWRDIYEYLELHSRMVVLKRNTNETKIEIRLNIDGTGKSDIKTGLHFFDHMLDQLARHGGLDLYIRCDGDVEVDDHHTIEDTAIALGEAFRKAIGDKRGMARYGFLLPMDDALAQVAVDFGGRNWIVWNVEFKREKVGDVTTEMFFHFFKSFSDAARCNLNIKAEGDNEHHKIESIFKALARALRMAVKRDYESDVLPTTKGIL